MFAFLTILMMIISILLILVVLIQPGKGDMISGMGGLTNQFTSMLGTRKAMDLLTKITIGFAAALLVLAVVTNKFFLPRSVNFIKPVTEGAAVPQTLPTKPVAPITQPQQQNQEQTPSQEKENK